MPVNVLEALAQQGWTSMGQLVELTKRSAPELREELAGLIGSGAVQKIGQKRGTRYALAGAELPVVTEKAPVDEDGAVEPQETPRFSSVMEYVLVATQRVSSRKKYIITDLAAAISDAIPGHGFSRSKILNEGIPRVVEMENSPIKYEQLYELEGFRIYYRVRKDASE